MINKKTLLGLLFLGSLLGSSLIYAYFLTKSFNFTQNTNKNYIVNTAKHFMLQQLDDNGKQKYISHSDYIERYNNDDTNIEKLSLKFFSDDVDNTSTINSDNAYTKQNDTKIRLKNNVVINKYQDSNFSIKAETNELNFFPEKNIIENNSPVKITQIHSDDIITGVSLYSNLKNNKNFILNKQIRTFNNSENTNANKNTTNLFLDGGYTICSDYLELDENKNTAVYKGNVVVFQSENKNIICRKSDLENYPKISLNNYKNYFLNLDDTKKNYKKNQLNILETTKSICEKSKTCKMMSGDTFTIYFDNANNIKNSIMTSKDKKNHSQFYNLSLDEDGKYNSIYGKAEILKFNMKNQKITLKNKANILQDDNHFSGDLLFYNMKNETIYIPENSTRSVIILDNDFI